MILVNKFQKHHQGYSIKRAVLESFTKFTRKRCSGKLRKVYKKKLVPESLAEGCNFIKKEIQTQDLL